MISSAPNLPTYISATYNVLDKIKDGDEGVIEIKKDKISGNTYGEFRKLTVWERVKSLFVEIETGMNQFLKFVCSDQGKTLLEDLVTRMQTPEDKIKSVSHIALHLLPPLGEKIKCYNNQAHLDNQKWYRQWGLVSKIVVLEMPKIVINATSNDKDRSVVDSEAAVPQPAAAVAPVVQPEKTAGPSTILPPTTPFHDDDDIEDSSSTQETQSPAQTEIYRKNLDTPPLTPIPTDNNAPLGSPDIVINPHSLKDVTL